MVARVAVNPVQLPKREIDDGAAGRADRLHILRCPAYVRRSTADGSTLLFQSNTTTGWPPAKATASGRPARSPLRTFQLSRLVRPGSAAPCHDKGSRIARGRVRRRW